MSKIEIERWDHYGEGTLAVIGPLGMIATIPSEWKPALLAALLKDAGAQLTEVDDLLGFVRFRMPKGAIPVPEDTP